jgi:hypothetical protein
MYEVIEADKITVHHSDPFSIRPWVLTIEKYMASKTQQGQTQKPISHAEVVFEDS